jgi:hypothetical protein
MRRITPAIALKVGLTTGHDNDILGPANFCNQWLQFCFARICRVEVTHIPDVSSGKAAETPAIPFADRRQAAARPWRKAWIVPFLQKKGTRCVFVTPGCHASLSLLVVAPPCHFDRQWENARESYQAGQSFS